MLGTLRRVQLQEKNTERGCTFKKLTANISGISPRTFVNPFTRVECQIINYHTYLSPQGCSQSLEKKKKTRVQKANRNPREVCDK